MRVSLATIAVAYYVHTGTAMPSDMAYYDAGRKVEKELGYNRSAKLFAQCAEALNANPTARVQDVAGALRDARKISETV